MRYAENMHNTVKVVPTLQDNLVYKITQEYPNDHFHHKKSCFILIEQSHLAKWVVFINRNLVCLLSINIKCFGLQNNPPKDQWMKI